MNMPTVGWGAVEYRRLVTTSWSPLPECSNSMPPAVLGAWKVFWTISSNARDSRGSRTNGTSGVPTAVQEMKHR